MATRDPPTPPHHGVLNLDDAYFFALAHPGRADDESPESVHGWAGWRRRGAIGHQRTVVRNLDVLVSPVSHRVALISLFLSVSVSFATRTRGCLPTNSFCGTELARKKERHRCLSRQGEEGREVARDARYILRFL